MIKVNLSGKSKKSVLKSEVKVPAPGMAMPLVLVAIVLVAAGIGYWKYSSLNSELTSLESDIRAAEAQRAKLAAVIKQDQVYEARKKTLENRVKIIQGLQNNQISPVIALDALSQAVDRTHYVWLSRVDQSNAVFTINGVGTSLLAIADFYSNLEATRYYRNIDISNAQDSAGNYTFSLKCEFAQPGSPSAAPEPELQGGN